MSASPLRTVGWGIYCASSWTWCIGMFLPVILLHYWGWPGFLAFAIPNVLGCAAMGYVVRSREKSRTMVAEHRRPMTWFSIATIAYHVYFATWITTALAPDRAWLAAVVVAIFAAAVALVSLVGDRWWPMLGVGTYAVSLATFVVIGGGPLATLPLEGVQTGRDLAATTPVLVLGFLLCPYLDLTFHRARQEAPSRHAFGVFGLTFAVMIVLTCAYAGRLDGIPTIVLVHMSAQGVFTCAAHLRESRRVARGNERLLPMLALLAAPLVLLTSPAPSLLDVDDPIYLRFLVFYGLVFPAWVIFFMRRRAMPRTTRNLAFYALAIAVLSPLYELGFLHGSQFLLPIAAWLLLVPALVRPADDAALAQPH